MLSSEALPPSPPCMDDVSALVQAPTEEAPAWPSAGEVGPLVAAENEALPLSFTAAMEALRLQVRWLGEAVDRLQEQHERELARVSRVAVQPPRHSHRARGGGPLSDGAGDGVRQSSIEESEDTHVLGTGSESVDKVACTLNMPQPTDEEFLTVCASGTDQEVLSMISASADVSRCYEGSVKCQGFPLELKVASPLGLVVLRKRSELVQALLEHRAEPDSTYGFLAGSEQLLNIFPTSHAVVQQGNLPLLQQLVTFGVDLHAQATLGQNLMWQAAWANRPHIARYLLEQRVDIEKKAQSPDKSTIRYTPLHTAVFAGHYEFVKLLIEAAANVSVDDGQGKQPLDDAAMKSYASIAMLLVAHSADPLREVGYDGAKSRTISGMPSDMVTSRRVRSMDLILSRGNPILLAAVAEGMARAPTPPPRIETEDLVQFLLAPGDAPRHIMNALCQRHILRYWEQGDEGGIIRMQPKGTWVQRERRFPLARFESVNMSSGPHISEIEHCYNQKVPLEQMRPNFISALMPKRCGVRGYCMFTPVEFFMCSVQGIHADFAVLDAIVGNPQKEILGLPTLTAIVNLRWRRQHWISKLKILQAVLNVAFPVLLAILLGVDNSTTLEVVSWRLYTTLVLMAVCWAIDIVSESAQLVGFSCFRLQWRHFRRRSLVYDFLVNVFTGLLVVWSWYDIEYYRTNTYYRTLLGVVLFVKWMNVLFSCKQLKSVALRTLPITSTLYEVGPFCVVLALLVIGGSCFYYALGIHKFSTCLVIFFRLVFMGEFTILEGQTEEPLFLQVDSATGVTRLVEPEDTEYYPVVVVMMMCASFGLSLWLMNLFIAILCLTYTEAAKDAWYDFLHHRARTILEHEAIRIGFVLCCSRRKARSVVLKRANSHVKETEEYLWYACPLSRSAQARAGT